MSNLVNLTFSSELRPPAPPVFGPRTPLHDQSRVPGAVHRLRLCRKSAPIASRSILRKVNPRRLASTADYGRKRVRSPTTLIHCPPAQRLAPRPVRLVPLFRARGTNSRPQECSLSPRPLASMARLYWSPPTTRHGTRLGFSGKRRSHQSWLDHLPALPPPPSLKPPSSSSYLAFLFVCADPFRAKSCICNFWKSHFFFVTESGVFLASSAGRVSAKASAL